MKKKIAVILMTIFFAGFNIVLPCSTAAENANQSSDDFSSYTLNRCIQEAIKNSLDIQVIEIQKKNKEIGLDKAEFYKRELSDGEDKIENAKESLKQLKQLSRAIAGQNDDFVIPDAITGGKLPAGTTKAQLNIIIGDASQKIDEGYILVEKNLKNTQVKELLGTKASIELDVVNYALEIAETKIGLLIQNSYYDVIKNSKITDLKNTALNRIKAQEGIAETAYKVGMKPKDDLLLCQILKSFAEIDAVNSQRQTNISILELKKNMNIELNREINLNDEIKANIVKYDMEEGIKSSLDKRLEIKKANAEYLISKLNFEITKRFEPEKTFAYREAELKMKEYEVNLKKVKLEIETDVRKSYENLIKTEEMLKNIQGLYTKAKENLEIATAKYETGFDFPSANLKDLNLEEASGTVIDVLAAQEKLSQIQEKMIELIFNYNQAKAKYLYDTGNSF